MSSPTLAPPDGAATELAAALYRKADNIAAAELSRLYSRAPNLTSAARTEVAATVQRVTLALLQPAIARLADHAGSVRGDHFAASLATLFALGTPEETQ
ncbi:hypothetical protein [Nonomuraea sp. NPDC049400]|uniref:hypothetical protein n=1 Tax=Nonomuraea sp. NPDC049400 TaxID=3364352 RepID=UPI003788D368